MSFPFSSWLVAITALARPWDSSALAPVRAPREICVRSSRIVPTSMPTSGTEFVAKLLSTYLASARQPWFGTLCSASPHPGTMDYREIAPAPALRPYVRCYWSLSAPPAHGAPIQRVLPDGCVEMIINLGAEFLRHLDDSSVERQPRALLVGPTTQHMSIGPTGTIRLVGIRFAPGGA